MALTTQRLSLTTAELAYLAALAEAPVLVGVPDPFAGALPEEIAQQLETAREALWHRGLITEGTSGALTIAPAWAGLLGLVFAPQAVLVVQGWAAAHGTATTVLYIGDGRAVEQRSDTGVYHLTEIDPETAGAHAADRLELPAPRGVTASPTALPTEALRKASALARESGPDAALSALVAAGMAPDSAVALAETLASPQLSWVLRFWRVAAGGWESQSLWLVEGPAGLFGLGDNTVQPEPGAHAVEMIQGFVAEALAVR